MMPDKFADLPEMPLLSISSPATVSKCSNFLMHSSDIFICSYPKSGTTWTQHIITSLVLLHRKKRDISASDITYSHVSDYAPFFEIDTHWNENDLIPDIQKRQEVIGRRIFNTHLRGNMLPRTGDMGKFIYITRSPLDACVSFYHHLSHQVEGCYQHSLDDFFQDWLDGKLPFGSWIDHFISYSSLVANHQVLHLSYEEMVQDLPKSVYKIIEYLQLDDFLTKDDLKNILPSFEFQDMKSQLYKFQPKSVTWKNDFCFLRKGNVGDHKNVLTKDKVLRFKNELIHRKLLLGLSSIFESNTSSLETFTSCLKHL